MTTTHGHCMCKGVTVTLTEQSKTTECFYCHCENCIRQGGGGGTYEILVPEDTFQAEGTLKGYIDRNTDSGIPLYRYFCGDCGCPIYSTTQKIPGKISTFHSPNRSPFKTSLTQDPVIVLKCGILDEIPPVTVELYCKNKQSWEPTVKGAKVWERSIVRSNPQ